MNFRDVDILTVSELGDDPTSVVVTDGSDEGARSMPCMASYTPRAVGDAVLVVRLGGGAWLVLGSVPLPSV